MKTIIVGENEAGQRLDKLLARYLKQAPTSFLYKMLRKKNITLNGKKAAGREQTAQGDTICIYLSDDTYAKFAGSTADHAQPQCPALEKSQIVYEDAHILLLNKRAGDLSQKSRSEDISVNERLISYLLQSGQLTNETLQTFRPAVCNRLDRNTSGLLTAGKTLAGLQMLSEVLRDRTAHKYYLCLAEGRLTQKQRLDGYLCKDEKTNRVTVTASPSGDAKPIVTEYTPLWSDGTMTLLEVWLITGRSHQIRAHLASTGHAILGDAKYATGRNARLLAQKYRLKSQLLHAHRLVFPQMEGTFSYLSGKEITAPVPKQFETILKETDLWQRGIQEDFAVPFWRT